MMKMMQNNRLVADRVEAAETFFSRFVGLMGRPRLDPSEGLLLRRCSRVHTCFMRFPIDVVYLSASHRVLHVETLLPWKTGSRIEGAAHVLELAAGRKDDLIIGCEVKFV